MVHSARPLFVSARFRKAPSLSPPDPGRRNTIQQIRILQSTSSATDLSTFYCSIDPEAACLPVGKIQSPFYQLDSFEMAQVKILKRSLNAVQCSSCKQRYDAINALDEHLETSLTGRRICPKPTAPAMIVCIGCERDFVSVKELDQHVQNSFLHNPELSQPTGRVVYVGRLPANITEQDIVEILFQSFVV
jgi:hypothetical protein